MSDGEDEIDACKRLAKDDVLREIQEKYNFDAGALYDELTNKMLL